MATLAGEAAIRIVPSLRGFKPEADRRLKTMAFDPVKVRIEPETARATAEIKAWKARQEIGAINVPVRADFQAFRRDLTTVEHIFKRSALQRAIKLNVKVIGLDALPALAYAAGSAATAIDVLGKSLLSLPGLLGGALASVGALAIGMRGVGAAFKAYGNDQKNAAQQAKDVESANRSLARSYRDYRGAVRDTLRQIQDLNAENRRSSLNVADAVLSVQEAAQRLREGGQRTILELQRDQLSYLQAVDHLQDVQTRAKRTAEDTFAANQKGVEGADAVIDALDRIAEAQERANKGAFSEYAEELSKVAPEARKGIEAINSFRARWDKLTGSVQNTLWEGLDGTIINLGQKSLPGLEIGLSRVASGLNKNFKSVGESLGSKTNQGLLERIFGNTGEGLSRFSRAMNPLIEGVFRLTKMSSDFLPRLGVAAEKVFTRFDAWTERIGADGSFEKWMDQGLNALTDLGNAASSTLSIFNSVSEAFIASGGNKTGFIGTLAEKTEQLAEFLQGRGKQTLTDYFTKAREFVSDLVGAISEMKPFIKTVTETAREWSSGFFQVAGILLRTADFIDRNTHLVKILLGTYLTFRTVMPVVDAMSTAWKNYTTVMTAAAGQGSPFRNWVGVQATANNIRKFRGEVSGLVGVQQQLTSATTTAAGAMQSQMTGVISKTEQARRSMQQLVIAANGAKMATPGAAMVTSRADERARREAAGIGVNGAGTIQQRQASAVAAYNARNTPASVLGTPIIASQMRDDLRRRLAARGTSLGGPLPADGYDNRRQQVAAMTALSAERRAEWRRMQRYVDPAGYARANRAQGQYLGLHPDVQRPAWRLPDEKRSPGMGPMQGPALPPGVANRVDPSKYYESKSRGLGPMQGPVLPPKFFDDMAKSASKAAPPVNAVVGATQRMRPALNVAGDQYLKMSQAMGLSNTEARKLANVNFPALLQASNGVTPALNGVVSQAGTASSTMKKLSTSTVDAQKKFPALAQATSGAVAPLNNVISSAGLASSKVKELGEKSAGTAGQIGTSGGGLGLMGRLAGLAGALGPTALLMAGIVGVTSAMNVLGEAHRNAASAAKAQDDALKNLATTLDSVSGRATLQTVAETGKLFQNMPIHGVFNDDDLSDAKNTGAQVNEALKRLNIDPGAAQRAASDPGLADELKAMLDPLKDTVSKQLAEQAPLSWDMKRQGIDEALYLMAVLGDQEAAEKYRKAKEQAEQQAIREKRAISVPDLAQVWNKLENKDAAIAAFGLTTTSQSNYAAAAGILDATTNTTGKQKLTDAGAQTFGPYMPDTSDRGVLLDPNTLNGEVTLKRMPPESVLEAWREKGWTVPDTRNPDGSITIRIPASEKPEQYMAVEGYKDGGLVRGPGTSTSDSILARVSDYEHIMNAKAVKYYGVDFMNALNNKAIPRFWGGGFPMSPPEVPWVPAIAPTPQAPPAPLAPPKPAPVPKTEFKWGGNGPSPWQNTPLPNSTQVHSHGGNPVGEARGTSSGTSGAGVLGNWVGQPYGLDPGTEIPAGGAGFPDWVYRLGARFGVQPGTYKGHQEGAGLNQGIDWTPIGHSYDSPEGAAALQRFADYVNSIPGAEQIIFENALTGNRVGRDPGDRGINQSIDDYYAASWSGHRNHVHTRFSSSIPLPEELGLLISNGDPLGLMSTLPGGGSAKGLSPWEAMQAKWKSLFDFESRYAKAYDPKNVFEFLGGQANSVGSQLLGIGTEFMSGITGINFGAILGPGQAVANEWLGGVDGESTGKSDDEGASGTVNSLFGDYLAGGGISAESQALLSSFGDLRSPGKKGAQAYRPLVRHILAQMAPQYGIKNMRAWEDALVKQIETESGGDPFSFNGSDSDGNGGTQQVEGLFNFLGSTFKAYNVTGGSINDPVAQIAAAIAYTADKYGMAEDGSPNQIGRGSGFAAGGFPTDGLVRLSNGEYRSGADATRFYGPALFNALNARAIPREAIRGFKGGGWPSKTRAGSGSLARYYLDKAAMRGIQIADLWNGWSSGYGGAFNTGGWPFMPELGAAGNAAAGTFGQTPGPLPSLGAAGNAAASAFGGTRAPSTGGAPGPGATAPAPDPGALPAASRAFQLAQPGSLGLMGSDPRSALGAAPLSNEHNNPALSAGIQGAWNHVGSLAATAASMAMAAGSGGAGAGPGAGMAASGIQAGFAMGGQVAAGLTNVLSSLLVGTATNGSTASASGVPMLPQREPASAGVRQVVQQRVHNGDVHIANTDEWRRMEQNRLAQDVMPHISKYG